MLNLAGLQKELRRSCPEELGIILLRRVMVRAAENIARERGMKALVTGESLGQVASQTIENLAVISAATDLLILRPLIAMDKQEIISRAQEIETYDISIRPYEDCCTLFLPRHPATRPSLDQLLKAESSSGSLIDSLLEESLFKKETIYVRERS
jgi:thiamine biosynthesis protein ThiI